MQVGGAVVWSFTGNAVGTIDWDRRCLNLGGRSGPRRQIQHDLERVRIRTSIGTCGLGRILFRAISCLAMVESWLHLVMTRFATGLLLPIVEMKPKLSRIGVLKLNRSRDHSQSQWKCKRAMFTPFTNVRGKHLRRPSKRYFTGFSRKFVHF